MNAVSVTLTSAERRALARFVADSALDVLPVYEHGRPDDGRPRRAVVAARQFVAGDPPSRLQRLAAFEAYQAAIEARSTSLRLAAEAAGDAASVALLGPVVDERLVQRVLRAGVNCALVAQVRAADREAAAERSLRRTLRHATPVVVEVLRRLPAPGNGPDRPGQLLAELDAALRQS